MYLSLYFALLWLASVRAAVQNAIPKWDVLPATEYTYRYTGFAQLYEHLNLSVHMEVTVQAVAGDSAEELGLQLSFGDATLTWNTTTGIFVEQNAIGDLSKWFSAMLDEGNTVTRVFYPSKENVAVVAFKKKIAELFFGNANDMQGRNVRAVVGRRLVITLATNTTHGTQRKISEKVTTYDENGLLFLVESDEFMQGQNVDQDSKDGILLGLPIHSHSTLTFIAQHQSTQQPQKPDNLLQDSPHITNAPPSFDQACAVENGPGPPPTRSYICPNVREEVPLSHVRQQISEKLSCATNHPSCMRQLSSILQLLSSEDIQTLVEQYFEPTSESTNSSNKLLLLDVLSHLKSPAVTQALTRHVLRSSQHREEDVTMRVLLHMATDEIPPDRESTDALLDLAFASSDVSPAVSQKALLTLGAMARSLGKTDQQLANEITHTLHSALEQHTGQRKSSTLYKHKRSFPAPSSSIPSLHATLIDSLGNAGAEISFPTLVSYLEESGEEESGEEEEDRDLSVKHAAVKALRSYSSEESAEALLRAAESSPHQTVQHLAAKAYQNHPRRKRDLSHLLTPSTSEEQNHPLLRMRRQADVTVSNVTMPAVSWNNRFGEQNISVDLGRVILNSFQIEKAPLTSHYNFSLYDETSFDADLLLSNGELHNEMLRTEFCLQGRADYNVNILTGFTQNLTAHQFQRYSATVGNLQQGFRTSYQRLVASETGYSGLRGNLHTALNDIPSRYDGVATLLDRYRMEANQIASEFELKSRAQMVFSAINASLTETSALALDSLQSISDAVDTLLPSLPPTLTSSLSVQGQTFVDSTFYLPYLPYAPQKALANIFSVYRRTDEAFTTLQSAVETFQSLTDNYGSNHRWLTPGIYLREVRGDIVSLLEDLIDAIDTASKSPAQTYDGATLSELQALHRIATSHLEPSVTALEQVGGPLSTQVTQLLAAFQETRDSFNSFTTAYERARLEIDVIFGQRFHPEFPWQLRSCDSTTGCGTYPSTSDGLYRSGIDLRVSAGSQIVSPFSGDIRLLDPASLPLSYNATSTLLLTPTESSLSGLHFLISNIVPNPSLNSQSQFFLSGDTIATSDDSIQMGGESFIHVEAFKTIEGVEHRINPTQFLQPNLSPEVSVEFGCNDFVTYIGGVVVDRRPIARTTLEMEYIGNPLVEGIPGHEFPQPRDMVVRGGGSVTSGGEGLTSGEVQFFQNSTFLMVGPIPVQFDFSTSGSYQLNFSLNGGLLSKQLDATITPYLHARATGSVRVGTTMFANVELSGSVIETSLPLDLRQDFNSQPMEASSSMDIVLAPSTLNLTTQLIQLTGAGEFADQEVLETQTLWEYSIPPLNRDEFYYEGRLADVTAPLFVPLSYASADQSDCFVRQLPGRPYGNPAFELEFDLSEPESVLNITYRAGNLLNGGNVISETELGGNRVVVPHNLLPAQEVFFTVSATNLNNLQMLASCSLHVYDRSPPMARINPIRAVSSHPAKIRALVVLFDEFRLDTLHEIAIGTIPGGSGDDVLSWQPFNVTQIYMPPDMAGDVLNLFNFSRNGRLPGDILQIISGITSVRACANLCNDLDSCRSFDYSRDEDNCILHSNIEGPYIDPAASYENNFNTTPLQSSQSYRHYEKLGVGNSTIVEFERLNFIHNRVYYINMRLRNRLGYTNVVSSSGFLVDLTPPTPGKIRNAVSDSLQSDGCSASVIVPACIDYSGEPNHRVIVDGTGSATVFNGPTPLLDAMYTSTSNLITANWQGFSDAESGIYGYTWYVGTSVGQWDIISPRDPHTALGSRQAWTNTGLERSLDLADGAYFFTVQAVSNVEYGGPLVTTVAHSTPYIVDTSPPILSEVEVIDYNVSSNQLLLTYNASDPGSNISVVSLALGRTPRDTLILPWREVDMGGYVEVDVVIPDGVPTWVKLRARNNAGLQTIAVAESSIMVDRTPPVAGTVSDGAGRTDIDYQSDQTSLCVNWEGFSDPESGIVEVQWGIGMTRGAFNVRPFLPPLSPSEVSRRSACASGLSLIPNATYYSTLIVFNGAVNQQSVTVVSDGVHTDITPPLPGTIFDGPDPTADHTHSSSLTTVEVTWANFQDYESGISQYLLTVFRQPFEEPDVQSVASDSVTGDQRAMVWNLFSFTNGDRIFVQIDAFNGAGLATTVNSSGITIDLTPPELAYIVDGPDPSFDLQYQTSSTSVRTSWQVRDNQSGISHIEGAIFEFREGRRVRIYPDSFFTDAVTESIPRTASSWEVNGLQLVSGSKYVTMVNFTNGAGLTVQYESNGVIVDTTPPIVQSVLVLTDTYTDTVDMNVVIANPNLVESRWIAVDPETGIREYLVGVVNENSTFVTPGGQDYISYGTATGGLIENLALVPKSGLYRVVVVAVNAAGTRSEPVYSEPFSVTTGDSAGVVYDGEDPGLLDIDYTDELTAITAHFFGFSSQSCGGLVRYEWAVGVESEGVGRETVMPFTDSGIVVGANGTGYAQALLPDLDSYTDQSLYITVRGITGCGRVLESTSNGFIIDPSPPSLEIVSTGNRAIERTQTGGDLGTGVPPTHQEYQTAAGFSSVWATADEESGIADDVSVKIGTYPGGENIKAMATVSQSYIRSAVMSTEGVPNYVTVAALNGAGLETVVISNPVVMDTTPPLHGELTCHGVGYPSPTLLWGTAEPNTTGIISCEWRGVRDPESGVSQYAVAIGTSPTDQSILSKTSLAGNLNLSSCHSPKMTFDPSMAYYVQLYARNGAGLERVTTSTSIYFDTTPPISEGMVVVLPNFETVNYFQGNLTNQISMLNRSSAVCLLDTDVVTVIFDRSNDLESEIFRYEIGVGYSSGNDDIVRYQTFEPTPLFGATALHILTPLSFAQVDLRAVYFNIKSYNSERLHSVISSNPVFIKSDTNIQPSWIFDGRDPSSDSDFQIATTEISGWFHVGSNCPIRSARWAVESVDGMMAQDYINVSIPDTVALGNHVENTFFLSSDQVQLFDDETYRILVQAVDYSGEVHILRSNGTTVTTRTLPAGLVRDGPIIGEDLNYQESLTMLTAHWSEFGDNSPEQRITYYEVAAGSDREYANTRTDIAPFTNVGLNTTHTFTNLNLVPQSVTYYITVRAHAVSGAYIDATSNGITAGYGHMIIPGVIFIPRYQSDTTTVSAHWSDFESNLPIRSYEWALGSHQFSDDDLNRLCRDITSDFSAEFEIFGFTTPNLETSVAMTSLSLEHNTTYYVTVRALDQAKKCIATQSLQGLTIDTTPPLAIPPSSISLGPPESLTGISAAASHVVYVSLGHDLEVTWESFSDAESEIAHYEVGIVLQSECGNNSALLGTVNSEVGFISVGMDHRIIYEGLNLVSNVAYVAEVRATNRAGLTYSSFSEPFLVDATLPIAGDIKDGSNWESDAVFQSNLSMLSAVFAHAKLPPQYSGVVDDGPCPNTTFYELSNLDQAWTRIQPNNLIGAIPAAIIYEQSLVTPSTGPPGINITAIKRGSNNEQIISGAYQTQVQFSNGGIVSVDIRAASGTPAFQRQAITSVVFIDSGETPNILGEFEPELLNRNYPTSPRFAAFGLQLHHSYQNGTQFNQQKVVMWYKSADPLAPPDYVIRELSYNLSEVHTYRLDFQFQRLHTAYSRHVDLYIDGDIVASLHGLPTFTDNTRLVLHVFNRLGYVPETEDNNFITPAVVAIFGNVTLPLRIGHLCDFGTPFFNKESPMVEFRAAAGTTPGATDVKDWETISFPCRPCLPGPCYNYGCEPNCTGIDPYLTEVTFQNLTLSRGYYTNQSDARDEFESTNQNTANTMISLLSDHFQPSVYYITVEAITASGRHITSSSNGVIIDTTPPEVVSFIEHFDVSFSTVIPTHFQGNNNTISARWLFRDLQSGIVEYLWAIGTRPFSVDVQNFESVGIATEAVNSNLSSVLQPNTTYYVTVIAINGAGVRSNATSGGITYVATELNRTELEALVRVEFTEVLSVAGENGIQLDILRAEREDRASVSWEGVGEDVEQTFWYIGSEKQTTDILPRTEVSFNNSRSATVDSGVLYLDGAAFANISEIIALAEGKEEDPADSLFYFEPGRLLYHSVEFCNFVHRCVVTETNPSIVIRTKDFGTALAVGGSADVTLVATQVEAEGRTDPSSLLVLDKTYRVTITARGGLDPGVRLFSGFLNNSDVTQHYRVSVPYISNPYVTMAQTSREIARRFTDIGGPSFFISFLGQENLNGPLLINATFDPTLDWATARPELAYWDIDAGLWREVGATCANTSRIDWATFTIAAEMCSTVLMESINRPESLSRRRRQVMIGGSGSGLGETDFLDRPTQFIVIRIGNFSINTPPQLNLPTTPLQVREDSRDNTFQLEYTDTEDDIVIFHLASLPKLGNATINSTGFLTYTPCPNCIGMDTVEIFAVEQLLGINNIPLTATGQVHIEIVNRNDVPEIFFYDPTPESANTYDIIANGTVYVYIEANRTEPAVAVRIASFDYDGYHDDLSISVQSGQSGLADYRIWMDAVNTPESLPVNWLSGSAIGTYTDYITFVGANITYFPFDSSFVGTDRISVLVQDSNRIRSEIVTVEIEVLPSWCLNNGVCGGSELDPNCIDIRARRAGFEGYNCSCPPGFGGPYCELQLEAPQPPTPRPCPEGVPLVQCEGDPCAGAVCPSHSGAECRGNYCGGCRAEWFIGATSVQCSATPSPNVCHSPLTSSTDCNTVSCDCPSLPYACPEDSVLVEVRQSDCCVIFECTCPNITCPHLMECGQGVQPVPSYRGNSFPGRCCPNYNFADINECLDTTQNTCSDRCMNQDYSFSCSCSPGTTLAADGISCGVCHYNGMQYLHGDRVRIGCNWCLCRSDSLSGERWHCTAQSCNPGCTYDGEFYSVGTAMIGTLHTCTCVPTDTNAEWDCILA